MCICFFYFFCIAQLSIVFCQQAIAVCTMLPVDSYPWGVLRKARFCTWWVAWCDQPVQPVFSSIILECHAGFVLCNGQDLSVWLWYLYHLVVWDISMSQNPLISRNHKGANMQCRGHEDICQEICFWRGRKDTRLRKRSWNGLYLFDVPICRTTATSETRESTTDDPNCGGRMRWHHDMTGITYWSGMFDRRRSYYRIGFV